MKKSFKNIKVLHVGNIANNAYLNSKLLRRTGVLSDVLCYNYYHIMGSPEWEDAKIQGNWGNDFNPDWSRVDLGGFKRPSWFYQGALNQLVWDMDKKKKEKIVLKEKIQIKIEEILYGNLIEMIFKIFYRFPLAKKIIINTWYNLKYIYSLYSWYVYKQLKISNSTLKKIDYYYQLTLDFKKLFPDRKDQLTLKDIIPYLSSIEIFKHIFNHYDIVQGYATDPIYALLANKHPYVAFEHGTIRDIPFWNSSLGRLTALAYRKADLVFITNSDGLIAAKKLGLKNFDTIPHPILSDWHRKSAKLLKKNSEFILFCPMRHDWQIKGMDIYIKNLPEIIKKSKKDIKIIFNEFGMDLEKSKKLIKKLNLEKYIEWHKPMPRWELVSWMVKADIVLDQLNTPAFGGIAAEGMQAGKPVLASYDHDQCKWMFPEKPPLAIIKSEEDIVKNLVKLINSPNLRKSIGKKSKIWFEQYLSEKIVINKLLQSYQEILKK